MEARPPALSLPGSRAEGGGGKGAGQGPVPGTWSGLRNVVSESIWLVSRPVCLPDVRGGPSGRRVGGGTARVSSPTGSPPGPLLGRAWLWARRSRAPPHTWLGLREPDLQGPRGGDILGSSAAPYPRDVAPCPGAGSLCSLWRATRPCTQRPAPAPRGESRGWGAGVGSGQLAPAWGEGGGRRPLAAQTTRVACPPPHPVQPPLPPLWPSGKRRTTPQGRTTMRRRRWPPRAAKLPTARGGARAASPARWPTRPTARRPSPRSRARSWVSAGRGMAPGPGRLRIVPAPAGPAV